MVNENLPTSAFRPQATVGSRPIADIESGRHLELMSDFADIDGVVAKWVRAADTTLYTEWANAPARFFHIAGDPPFECFQISVEVPEAGRTSVTARAIDTNDDTDKQMVKTWRGPIGDLDEMLGAAVALVVTWKGRERLTADPTSTW